MRHKWLLPISLLVLFVLVNGAWAKKTMVVVHVVSKDAKFVGTSMGGALVTVKNADTGEVLAKGRTTGTTGDTEMLMKTNMTRRDPLVDEKAARFIAMVNIDEPTRAEITAMGPAAQRQSANIVSITHRYQL